MSDQEDVLLKSKDIPILREEILKEQKGICPVCKKQVQSPVLDHFHKRRLGGDGKIRGVLCRSCNIFIGKIENSCKRFGITLEELPEVLISTSEYFKKTRYNYIHPSEAPLTEEDIKKIKEYFLLVYPKKRKIPEIPVNMLLNKDFKTYLKDISRFIKNERRKKQKLITQTPVTKATKAPKAPKIRKEEKDTPTKE